MKALGRTRVRVVFVSRPEGVPKWPSIHLDPHQRAGHLREEVTRRLPEVEFVGWDVATSPEEMAKVAEKLGSEEGLLVFNLGSSWELDPILDKGLPTIIVNDPLLFGGAGMVSHSRRIREKKAKAVVVSTTDWEELDRKFRLLHAVSCLKRAKFLSVGRDCGDAYEVMGARVERVSVEELNSAYEGVDEGDAREVARGWIEGAEAVVEPSEEEVVRSARMYLAMKRLMDDRGAVGIAIDCLGLFYAGRLPAYPCLGFAQIDDEPGTVSACEDDIVSLLTKLVVKLVTGKPSFLSEPDMDSSRDLAIYAHCLSATKMAGLDMEPEPYIIRSHAEDDRGAALQVRFRSGIPVTVVKIIPDGARVLLLRGESMGAFVSDRACRSKLAVKVSDAQRLLEDWEHGWHRVVVYGDHARDFEHFARLVGFKVHYEV